MSSPQEIAMRILDSGGASDDWQPPAEWIPVPEPDEYDIYILLQAQPTGNNNAKMKIAFSLYKESTSYPGAWVSGDNIYCDFGDGTEGIYSGGITHTYTEPGQYLVHIIGNEKSMKFDQSSLSKNLLIFKSGEKIICDLASQYGFREQSSLAYVKINDLEGIYIGNRQIFQGCFSLKKMDFKIKPTATSIGIRAFETCRAIKGISFKNCKTINELAFQGCTAVKTISFPNVTSIDTSAFSGCYNLESVYLPNCTSIGDQAFYQCYNLQKIIVSENCTFGTNCFQSCYSLFPRPDGSIN